MRTVIFCHSLISDWNHGNAHFLRGIATELLARGHQVRVYEPRDSWSAVNLIADAGPAAIEEFRMAYPALSPRRAELEGLDLDEALDGADLVIVHEWSAHPLVERIGRHRSAGGRYVLLFHDTHHRSVTDQETMSAYDLQHYDGVLAFGEVIREKYLALGWARRAWTWHEAADTAMFHPVRSAVPRQCDGDLVWIGNWGDGERTEELRRYLVHPVQELGLRARIHGVRYPPGAVRELAAAGIDYAGWLANYRVPDAFSRFAVTVHVPRRPYVTALPGIPTIRVFEALACGIPLVSCWWDDCERLFRPGKDYLVAETPREMVCALREVLSDAALARQLARDGLDTIRARHTCAHRVNELFDIAADIRGDGMEKTISA